MLKEEKRKLLEQVKEQKDEVDNLTIRKQIATNQMRDASVMCTVITRHVGVGPQYPKVRTVSTETDDSIKLKDQLKTSLVSQSSQAKVHTEDISCQTDSTTKRFHNFGVNVKPELTDFGIQVQKDTRTIGVSEDTLNIPCPKCNVAKKTIGVGSSNYADQYLPVSLKSLSANRSKSFNLGEEKLNLNLRYRTIGCQSENYSINKFTQYESKLSSQHSQTETKVLKNESSQYDIRNVSQLTDTHDLSPKKDVYCSTMKVVRLDVSCNTMPMPAVETVPKCAKCSGEPKREESGGMVSRIPRPSHIPTTPTESRKFKRQNTYTKISSENLEDVR